MKRPLEAFKYLLGFSRSNGEAPLEQMILQLDEALIASSNEKHLAAFKEVPDFASFQGAHRAGAGACTFAAGEWSRRL